MKAHIGKGMVARNKARIYRKPNSDLNNRTGRPTARRPGRMAKPRTKKI